MEDAKLPAGPVRTRPNTSWFEDFCTTGAAESKASTPPVPRLDQLQKDSSPASPKLSKNLKKKFKLLDQASLSKALSVVAKRKSAAKKTDALGEAFRNFVSVLEEYGCDNTILSETNLLTYLSVTAALDFKSGPKYARRLLTRSALTEDAKSTVKASIKSLRKEGAWTPKAKHPIDVSLIRTTFADEAYYKVRALLALYFGLRPGEAGHVISAEHSDAILPDEECIAIRDHSDPATGTVDGLVLDFTSFNQKVAGLPSVCKIKCLCDMDPDLCLVCGSNRSYLRDVVWDLDPDYLCKRLSSSLSSSPLNKSLKVTGHCFRNGAACHLLGCIREDGSYRNTESIVRRHIRWAPGSRMVDLYSRDLAKFSSPLFSWI